MLRPENEPVVRKSHRATQADAETAPPTFIAFISDPATPFWALDMLARVQDKDPVDVLNLLEVMVRMFEERVRRVMEAKQKSHGPQ